MTSAPDCCKPTCTSPTPGNSAGLSKTILSEVDQLGGNLLLAAGIIGSLYFIIYRVVRVRLGRIGRERREANTARFQTASEALGGIKAITLTGKASTYADVFPASGGQRYPESSTAVSGGSHRLCGAGGAGAGIGLAW